MGCSSSSAQTVEQEKRPGTKPEESNGDTVDPTDRKKRRGSFPQNARPQGFSKSSFSTVRNGIIAEDVQTIEDHMQLPVQTASPDDAKAGPEDETEAVLEAVEAQEDLGSGEDLLVVPEPPAAGEELAPQPTVQEEVAVTVTEVLSPVEEALPVETVSAEAPSEVKAVEALEETTEAQPVEAVQTEVPVLVKEEVVEEAPGTAGVLEEGEAEEASKAATEDANPVQDEAPPGSTSPETDPETPGAAEASTATTDSVANEDAAPTERSRPADAVIDTTISAESIPEMLPVTAAAAAAQAEPHSATEEETEVSTVSSGASSEEASGPVPEPAEGSEAPPVAVNPESSMETAVTAEVSEGKPSVTQTEAPAEPEPATEPVPESSLEVSSVNEASKDKEDEIAKKQD